MNLDILIPTFERPASLAITLAGLLGQSFGPFRIVVSDQSELPSRDRPEVASVLRALEASGHEVETHRHLPRQGMAEQRQFLLDQAVAPAALFLDDDILLEPWAVGLLAGILEREGCGFAGMAPIGLSYRDDVRPHEQSIEFWDGPITPELVRPRTDGWSRHKLHNAANALHLQQRLGIRPDAPRTYRVAWVGGCVLYDTVALRDCGGFSFWDRLPAQHSGEDVMAQLNVMARYGGCGVLPSGAYHLELRTTIPDRAIDAPHYLQPAEPAPPPGRPPSAEPSSRTH